MVTKLPPGPKLPKLLMTARGILHPLEFLDECAHRYGDPFTSRFANFPPFVIFSSSQAIQEIFSADAKVCDSGSSNRVFRPSVGDNSLLLLDGDRPIRPSRRGATFTPQGGVPLVLEGQRTATSATPSLSV